MAKVLILGWPAAICCVRDRKDQEALLALLPRLIPMDRSYVGGQRAYEYREIGSEPGEGGHDLICSFVPEENVFPAPLKEEQQTFAEAAEALDKLPPVKPVPDNDDMPF